MNSKNSATLAIPFISFHENQGFKLSPEAQEFLNSLPEDRQLGIVSIVGKYRTGKSFFVNRVLLDQKKSGFQVGPTINPCTKGLWLWKKTIPSESNKNMDVILIDTQGFGGMDQNANHDSRIFLFSLLLSSYFIYNSVGSIDQNAINTLNLIINLTKEIQTKSNNFNEDESQFPSFLWVVRDFTLKLVDKNQTPITSKQYLQNALELQKGTSDATQNKNKIRKLLKQFFQDRDCETMVRPTEAEKDLQKLDQIDNSMLRPQFVSQVKFIRNKVYTRVKPKKINGQCLNGNMLVELCKGYMKTINEGQLPNVQSAWFYVCRSQCMKAASHASKILQNCMSELITNPIDLKDFHSVKQQIREKVMEQFRKRAMNAQKSNPDLIEKLQRRMQDYFTQFERKQQKRILQQEKQRLQMQNQRLMAAEQNMKAEIQSLQKIQTDNLRLKSTIERLHQEMEQVKMENYRLKVAEEQLLVKVKQLETIHKTQEALKKTRDQTQQLELSNEKLQQQNHKLKKVIEKLKSRVDSLEEEHSDKNSRNQIENNKWKAEEQKLMAKIWQLETQNRKLKSDTNKDELNMYKQRYEQWLLERAYLQNQVAFLKNTFFENKKLHDALLLAFQRSVSTNEQEPRKKTSQKSNDALQKSINYKQNEQIQTSKRAVKNKIGKHKELS